MLDLIFKLASLSNSVNVTIVKKGDLIHLSIANSSDNAELKFKPILISGTEQQIIDELPTITTQLSDLQRFSSNLKSITDTASNKLKEKISPSVKKVETAKTASKSTEKAEPKSMDLFGNTSTPKVEEKPKEVEEVEDLEEVDEVDTSFDVPDSEAERMPSESTDKEDNPITDEEIF